MDRIYFSLVGLVAWVGIFSIWGMILVLKDKQKARQGRRRVPEKRLMWIGVLGGAWLMWLTMVLVHHKTRHNKFMIGFPVMVMLQVALLGILWNFPDVFYFFWTLQDEFAPFT